MASSGGDGPVAPDPIRLAEWLTAVLGGVVDAAGLRLASPSGGGWSNDTWLVDLGDVGERSDSAPCPRRVVLRLQPDRRSMFPRYDLARQTVVLEALGSEPDVPTPRVLGRDLEGERLGRPAFLMEFVAGRTPSDDRPTFAESGWLAEAGADEQRRFHTGMLDALVALHRVDVDRHGLEGHLLGRRSSGDQAGGSSNVHALAELHETWDFDRGERWPACIEAAFAVIGTGVPEPTARCLLWGDARPANVVVEAGGFEPVALLDWELATIGTPEIDLTWMAEMNWMRMQGAGLRPLAGFLDDASAIEYYRERSGRDLGDLDWYRRLAALRVAVLMHRYLRAMVHAGRLPGDHKLLSDTVASRRVEDVFA